MVATPAWPPRSTPRLFIDEPLGKGERRIDGLAAHYLLSVMRLKAGDPGLLFDDRTGEWLATVAGTGKRDLTVAVGERLRERESVPDLWLCAAPLKKGRIDWMAEKACELGVARFTPVLTRRTVVDRPNTDRLRAHMVEAAEQCGRTALPEVAEPVKLDALLRDWPAERALFFADETGGASAFDAMRGRPGPAGTTGEERVTATRQARAAERTTATWARSNAADLRRLAGQITALTDLPPAAHRPLGELHAALAHDDPADLIAPLAATRPHLAAAHPGLAARLDTLSPP